MYPAADQQAMKGINVILKDVKKFRMAAMGYRLNHCTSVDLEL